ncbi:hypothetical protein GGS21DRAFT_513329 [Xylaria nigripes]|nr:hypothetical protein GGS21DRAFT_513329 [Xylaria nigripes]
MATLLNFWNSPNNNTNTNTNKNSKTNKHKDRNMRPSSTSGLSTNGAAPNQRGAKRKAKPDPYEELAGTTEDDDEVIPARISPSSQRTARSRMSSATPGSSVKSRPLLLSKRGIARPSIKSQRGDASSTTEAAAIASVNTATTASPSRASKKAHSVRAKAADTARTHPDSTAPEAPMGGLGLLHNNAISAPAAPASAPVPEPRTEVTAGPPPQDKGKAKQPESETAQAAKQVDDEDHREVKEVAKLLEHRMARDQSGFVELLVQWVGEDEKDASWESESEIQQDADEILYEYWKTQGGRINALFHKPKNPPPETYHVFKVLRHEKRNRGGFQFEVQWVGHPPTRGETSMEAETKLRHIAPESLAAYWDSVGGRANFLAPRGRVKKSRTE